MSSPLIFNKSLEEIEKIIVSHLPIKQDKKVETGEVFTPFHLIVEMLEKLPKKLWKNPKLKWLDPGSGVGNFSMLVFYYLDKGLTSWEKDTVKRRNHIIENMIYMVELTKSNVTITKKIFGNKVNVCNCDFLLNIKEWTSQFGTVMYDITLGNPPYNQNGMKGKGRSDPGSTGIWNKFVKVSLQHTKKDGHCLFFTPNSWTELKSGLSKKIIENQIVLIKNFDVVNAYKLFEKKAGSLPLCYYLLRKGSPSEKTLLHDSYLNDFVQFDVNKYRFIPNKNIHLIEKILQKTNSTLKDYYVFTPPKQKSNKNIFFDSYSKEHPYPLVNYVHKKLYISYSKTPSKLQNGRPKLIFPNYSMGYPLLDKDGVMDVGGRSSYAIYIPDNNIEKLQRIQRFFFTNLAFTLINSLKTAQKFLSTRTFSLFPDVSKSSSVPLTESGLIKYFNLKSTEINAINQQINKGEGNVTETRKEELMNFSLKEYLTDEQIKFIKQKVKK